MLADATLLAFLFITHPSSPPKPDRCVVGMDKGGFVWGACPRVTRPPMIA
jgi:hypothetical protein